MIIETSNRIKLVKEYYFSKKLRSIAKANSEGADIINLGIGNPDMSPPIPVIDSLMSSMELPTAHMYQSYKGVAELRHAISKWYKQMYNVSLDENQEILPLMGSKEGIMHIAMSFLQDGDEVLVPNPGYPAYASASKLAGAKILPYHLTAENDYLPDLDFLRKFSLKRVKIMWINYPNMPTGAKISIEKLKELISFAKQEKILLVFDNAYSFLLNDNPNSIFNIPGAMDVAIELNSLSKIYNMAGWRVGFLGGKKSYLDEILKFKSNMDSGMFLPVQLAAIKALSMGEEWNSKLNEIYRNRRSQVWELLDLLNCGYSRNSAGLFVWAEIPKGEISGEEYAEEILQTVQVFLTPGFIFGSNGNRYIRVSLCQDETIIKAAIKRINNFRSTK